MRAKQCVNYFTDFSQAQSNNELSEAFLQGLAGEKPPCPV